MRTFMGFRKVLALFLALSLVPLIMSCGGGGGESASGSGGEYTSVTIVIGGKAVGGVPAGVAILKFTVSSPGMTKIERIVNVTSGSVVTETFDVPTGYARTFTVDAFNASSALLYTGSTTVDLLGDPVAVAVLMHVPPVMGFTMVGPWGYAEMEHDPITFFHTGAGLATFNSDGTGTIDYVEDFTGSTLSGTDPMTYSLVANGDGSYNLVTDDGSGPDLNRAIPSEDGGKVLLLDTTGDNSVQNILVPIRVDTSMTYTNADLSGQYYLIQYGAQYIPTSIYNFWSSSHVWTADGAGNWTESGFENYNGSLSPTSGSGTYTVYPDGTFYVGNSPATEYAVGHVTSDHKIAVMSDPLTTTEENFIFAMKRADMVYSTANLAGTWVMIGLGESFGSVAFEEVGKVVCNASGNCTGSVKSRDSLGGTNTTPISETYSVAPDGSFGGSLPGSPPSYAGAIGDGGNVFIMNRSFDPLNLNDRNIIIGVRCSGCGSFVP